VHFVDPHDAEQRAEEARDVGALAVGVRGVLVLVSPEATPDELRTATVCAVLSTQGLLGA
jgi:hypothetical protein